MSLSKSSCGDEDKWRFNHRSWHDRNPAHPVCAEVNNVMQQRTGVQYNTSEQHKDLTTARQVKYMTDSCELFEFLESRNSFGDNCSLRSIATGINAGISGNVDTAKECLQNVIYNTGTSHFANKWKWDIICLSIVDLFAEVTRFFRLGVYRVL